MSQSNRVRALLHFLRAFLSRAISDGVSRTGAELAYYLLFSTLALLLLGSGALSRLELDLLPLLERLSPLIPGEIRALMGEFLTSSGRDAGLLAGIPLTLYSMTRVINTLLVAFSRIYRVKKPRRWLARLTVSVVLAALMLVSLPLMLLLIFLGDGIIQRLIPALTAVWDVLRLALLILWALITLTTLYTLAPNRPIRPRAALPGAAFAGAAWVIVSMGFSFYVNRIARYSVLYGSLSAMIVLMLWLWLTGIILLLGGLFNHLLEVCRFGDKLYEKKRSVQADPFSLGRQAPPDGE